MGLEANPQLLEKEMGSEEKLSFFKRQLEVAAAPN